jgi:hypothetical protein
MWLSKLFFLCLPFLNWSYTSAQVPLQEKHAQGSRQNSVPTNVDSSFEAFIKYFSRDSLFQISRIDFPLIVKQQPEGKIIAVEKENFNKLDFEDKTTETREFDKYSQSLKVAGNKARIEIRGIDNGIFIDVTLKE